MTILIIYLIVIFNLISIWNGYVVLWGTTNNEKRTMYSNRWHTVGLAIRVMLWGLIPLIYLMKADITAQLVTFNWLLIGKWTVLFVIFGGLYYDMLINAIRFYHEHYPPLTYVDYKNWNKFFVDALRTVVVKIIHNKTDKEYLEITKRFYFWSRVGLSIILLILTII